MAFAAGEVVRETRIKLGWSLATLAARAGMSASHVAQLEAGKPASLESYARIAVSLNLRPDLAFTDPRRKATMREGEDFVHAAMGEVEARRLQALGFQVAIDEPYQHYQFAGRADVVAWDRDTRALLHIENRTRFPNVQEALGSYRTKRAYLGRVLAERLGVREGWVSETHVIAALWSSEMIHVLRLREATFRATCPDTEDAFRSWWAGDISHVRETTSSLVLFDPASNVRDAYRFAARTAATRPRYRGYAEAADRLRGG
jgi:transcriptional regulator with XRE-family HTH domain